MTATELLRRLTAAGCRPAAEAGELTLETDPPRDLERPLGVLHTGVVAALTGRPWVGCGFPKPAAAVLDPARLIPLGVQVLTVAGVLNIWDRLHPAARLDCPDCFERPAAPARR